MHHILCHVTFVYMLWVVHLCSAKASSGGGLEGYEVGNQANLTGLERVKQLMVPPPGVPIHSQTPPKKPRIVEVELVIAEKEEEIAPGVFYWLLTYNGHAPGPLIIVHEGDYVEVTLKNPRINNLTHNVDFHASTGALGGGLLTNVGPGEKVVLRFSAIKPGIFIYHCAPGGHMIPWHVVHGMNGAIVVLPRGGLKDDQGNRLSYKKAIYIGGQDYYIPRDENGAFRRFPNPLDIFGEETLAMKTLTPTHLPFGQKMYEMTDQNALKFKVGDTLMIFHSQGNRQSFPHLIGGHGDWVWERGNLGDPPIKKCGNLAHCRRICWCRDLHV